MIYNYFSLTSYSTRDGTQQNIPENIQLFDIFSEQIAEVVKVRLISNKNKSKLNRIESFKYASRRYNCLTKCIT
jgi:hypothetical protein